MKRRKMYSVVVIDPTSNPVIEGKYPIFPADMKLLKEMFTRMEEMLTDDIYERYMPGETIIHEVAVKLWRKDVDTYVDLCKAFGFRVNKRGILKKGDAWIKTVE